MQIGTRGSPRYGPSFRSHGDGEHERAELVDLAALIRLIHSADNPHKIGDLKLFEPETIFLLIAVGDREER